MGLLTDFFVASFDELRSAMPGWLRVSDERNRLVTNPFTGQSQLDWGPIDDVSGGGVGAAAQASVPFDIRPFPNVQWRRVDLVKLATLQQIVLGTTFEEGIAALARPALLHKEIEDEGVYCLPAALVEGLAETADVEIERVARRWAATEELQIDGFSDSDTLNVLRSLVRLANIAKFEGKQVYLWWSL